MAAQGDDLDGIRAEASGILQTQYERGSNGYVKSKYVTLTIEAESIQAARARFSRIEADTPEPLQGHGRGGKGAGRQGAAGAAARPPPSQRGALRL